MTAGGFFNTLSINNLRQSWKHLEFELPDDGSEFYHTDDPHGIRHNQGRDWNNFHQICQNAVYSEVIFINLCDI